jgi:hypothetical protein
LSFTPKGAHGIPHAEKLVCPIKEIRTPSHRLFLSDIAPL